MTDSSARFALPHILPGQAQKETFHNEALAIIDGVLHPAAESRGLDVPPASPEAGQSWIVGSTPSGEWEGKAAALAIYTRGGWRFTGPCEGMLVWLKETAIFSRWTGIEWIDGEIVGDAVVLGGDQVVGTRQEAIPDPSGGTTIDAEGRAVTDRILAALRAHGLIGS